MKIVTAAEMKAIEQAADTGGLSYDAMMEHAGRAVADEALRVLGEKAARRVLILVGPGNNGGDGLVAARHLHDAGASVSLYVWKRKLDDDANYQQTQERRVPTAFAAADGGFSALRATLNETDVVVDALLGTGVARPIEGQLQDLLAEVRDHRPALLLAVDLPTGLNPDTGALDPAAVPADVTVTFALPKRGFYQPPGAGAVGRVVVADIGVPPDLAPIGDVPVALITDAVVRPLLPTRSAYAHKNTFGRALVLAGSVNYPGAAYLAATAAARVGAGLVTLGTARSLYPAVTGAIHAITYLPLPEDLGAIRPDALKLVGEWLPRYQALLVGPGLGTYPGTFEFVQHLMGVDGSRSQRRHIGFALDDASTPEHLTLDLPPTVVDADGLNALAAVEGWPARVNRKCRLVLTPHAGEMARLTGLDAPAIEADRIETARRHAAEWGQVVVLKGAHTVVAAPDGRAMVSPFANPALATAGTGDVLAGAIVGLLAQGLAPFDAAVCGVYLHARAGELVRDELGAAGAVADDLLPRLPLAIRER
ncbi:MAG: NAD(P)H-hydrate dehydratase [Chloroflexi bacterium]|nr:NAD(P)H-hydrate dehydratase [Chloroflexota bacterium]MBU1748011.1 NAD(P)H-hydrate dehydratase [Chloroflexota bacterium]